MRRKNRQLTKHERKGELLAAKVHQGSRIIDDSNGIDRRKIGGSRVPSVRIARRIDGESDVTRRGLPAILPAQTGNEMQPERTAIVRPLPFTRGVWCRRERAVVAGERYEQHISLYLTRERVHGDEWIAALEVRARGVDDRLGRALRDTARQEPRDHEYAAHD